MVIELSGVQFGLKSYAYIISYIHTYIQTLVKVSKYKQHKLIDPEIATSSLMDDDHTYIYFCCGNLSVAAIDKFVEMHTCNKFCAMLGLISVQ